MLQPLRDQQPPLPHHAHHALRPARLRPDLGSDPLSLLTYALGQLGGVAILAGSVLTVRIALNAAYRFHTNGMARVHHHTQETNP
jgi:hypothetical protein